MKYLANVDLVQNELQNARMQNLASAPANPVAGQVYYNTSLKQIMVYIDGTTLWVPLNSLVAANVSDFAEAAQDAVGAILTDGTTIDFTYTDATPSITAEVKSDSITNALLANMNANTVKGRLTAGSGDPEDLTAANLITILTGSDGTGSGLDADLLDGNHASAFATAGHNHSGVYSPVGHDHAGVYSPVGHGHVHTDVSDFDTGVRENRLDQMAAPTASVSLNSQKITNLATPTADADAVTKAYVDALATGLDAKNSVRAATTGNITLSGAQTIDTVNIVAGDRVLVRAQTNPAENGIYVAAAGAWARATDNDSWAELISAYVFVEAGGSYADSGFLCTVEPGGTLGTTGVTWVQFSQAGTVGGANVGTGTGKVYKQKSGTDLQFKSVAAGNGITVTNGTDDVTVAVDTAVAVRKYAANIGNAVLLTIPVTHNLGTQDITWAVRSNSGSYEFVMCDGQATDANTLTLVFAVAPTNNQYRVIVHG